MRSPEPPVVTSERRSPPLMLQTDKTLAHQNPREPSSPAIQVEISLPPKLPTLPPPIPLSPVSGSPDDATKPSAAASSSGATTRKSPTLVVAESNAPVTEPAQAKKTTDGTALSDEAKLSQLRALEAARLQDKHVKDIRRQLSSRKQSCAVTYTGPKVLFVLGVPPGPVTLPFTGLRGCLDAVMAEDNWVVVRNARGASVELVVAPNPSAKPRDTEVHVVTPAESFTVKVRQAASAAPATDGSSSE